MSNTHQAFKKRRSDLERMILLQGGKPRPDWPVLAFWIFYTVVWSVIGVWTGKYFGLF